MGARRVLLDTGTFIKASFDGLGWLSATTRALLNDPDTERLLSVLSHSEIAIKAAIGKLQVSGEDSFRAAVDMELKVIPFTARHAQSLFALPFREDHRDPFDRMLIATALAEDVPIVSVDRKFKAYAGLTVLR